MPTCRLVVLTLCVAVLGACGDADSGSSTGSTDDMDDGTGTGSPDVTGSVERVLTALGVNVQTGVGRVDPDGSPLPEDYAPLGSRAKINVFSELLLLGVPIDDDNVATSGHQSTVTNLVPGANNSLTWEVLTDPALATTPWAELGARRGSATLDVDADGVDEVVVVYQDEGDVELVVIQDSGDGYAIGEPSIVDTATWDRIFVEAGDFDGDGDDDVLLGLIDPAGDATLKLLANGEGEFTFVSPEVEFPRGDRSISNLRMAAGNLDFDPAEELALVLNSGATMFGQNGEADVSHDLVILDDATTRFASLRETKLEIATDTGTQFAVIADVDLGDLDGDGLDEVVLAGLNRAGGVSNYGDFRYFIEVLDDGRRDFVQLAEAQAEVVLEGENFQPQSSGASQRLNFAAVVAADVDGDGASEFLVNQRLFQSMRTSPGAITPYDAGDGPAVIPSGNLYTREGSSGQDYNFNWATFSFAAADVTKDGRDNLVIFSQVPTGSRLEVWGVDQIEGWSLRASFEVEPAASHVRPRYPQLLLPDLEIEDTTAALRYSAGSHRLVFTEPIIIAALAAAPCATDRGQDLSSSCRTAYGNAVSDRMARTDGQSLVARASAGINISEPLTNNGIEVLGSIEARVRNFTETSYTLRRELLFETGPIEDSVVFTTVPLDLYSYEILSHPDPQLIGETVEVRLPREPITLMTTRGFYNQNILEDGVPIDDRIFRHVEGQPDSYLTQAEKNQLIAGRLAIEGTPASVGEGTGQSISTISSFEETTTGTSYEYNRSIDVRVTGGITVAEVSVGTGSDSAIEISRGTESIYQGAVGNIDATSFDAGLDYGWGLFTYVYEDPSTGQTFEVLNYWVDP